MFNLLSLWNLSAKEPDIPRHMLMTKEEMLQDALQDYYDNDNMSWDDLLNEVELIESMYDEGETQ